MNNLPVDILTHIALLDIPTYCAMLAIPAFARHLISSPETQQEILNIMCIEKEPNRYCGSTWKFNVCPYTKEYKTIKCTHGVKIHHYGNKSILEYDDGRVQYHTDGEWHREDGPANIRKCSEEWVQREIQKQSLMDGLIGDVSRSEADIKAIYYEGLIDDEWYLYGERHREDGPALIVGSDNKYGFMAGTQLWFQHGKMHRVEGPAAEADDNTNGIWYINALCYGDYRKGKDSIYIKNYQRNFCTDFDMDFTSVD